jgi:deoxyadenosine/deoxycytidine kinase
MRIAISGTANVGKSTLIKDFLQNWPTYKTPENSYREFFKQNKYPHNKNCNKEGQWAILNHMIDEMQKYSKDDNIIFDRCPLDNLIYSLWSCEKSASDIDEEFLSKCIPIIKESMKHLDVIFFIPISKSSPIPIVQDGSRETDSDYITEIDNLFKAIFHLYQHSFDNNPFLPNDDCPAIIEIFGNPLERIMLLQQYLNVDGEVIGDEAGSILDPENIKDLENLLMEQMTAAQKESVYKREKELVDEFENKEKNKKTKS